MKFTKTVLTSSLVALFIACGGGGSQTTADFAISIDTLEVKTLAEGLNIPAGLGIDLDSVTFQNQIFVAEQAGGGITAIAQDGNKTAIASAGLSAPTDILFDILPNAMFVAESQSNEISRVDFNQNPPVTTVIASLPQGVFPRALATDGTYRYVAARNSTKVDDDQVYNFSTNSPTLIARGLGNASALLFRLHKDKPQLLVTNTKAGTISSIDLENTEEPQTNLDEVVRELNNPTAIAIGPSSEFIYICETGANLVVRTDADGKNKETVAKIEAPSGMMFDSDGNLYVSSSTEGKVFKVVGLKEVVQ